MNIWSVLGLSVTFVAVFCVLMLEVFQDKNYYETYKWYFCGLLIGIGGVLWILGKFVLGKKKEDSAHPQATLAQPPVRNQGETGEPNSQTPEAAQPRLPVGPVIADDSEEAKAGPFFLFTPGYWGAMLVTFGLIVIFIVPNYSAKKVTARTMTNAVVKPKVVPPSATNKAPPPPPEPVKPPKFPDFKVQGIIYRPGNSSVVINGKPRFVGDYVGDAEIVAIDRQSITVELRGFKKTYLLEK